MTPGTLLCEQLLRGELPLATGEIEWAQNRRSGMGSSSGEFSSKNSVDLFVLSSQS